MEVVENYFKYQLAQGLSIPEVVDLLNGPVLPQELAHGDFKTVKRYAQIVSSRYMIDYNNTHASQIRHI